MTNIACDIEWWIINEAGLDLDKLPKEEIIFKTENVGGRTKLHVLRDKRILAITYSGR